MNIFILTGAGVSAESGLGTFRDKDGLWARFDPMKLATPEAFAHDPDQVHAFYNMRRKTCFRPNPMRHIAPSLAWKEVLSSAVAVCSYAPRTSTTCMSAPVHATLCIYMANC